MKICYLRKRGTKNLLWIALFLVLSNTINCVSMAVAESTTAFSVEPASIEDETIEAGDKFSINLTISDVTNLGGYEFNLTYNTDVLTATKINVLNGTDDFFAESKVWYSEILDSKGTAIAVVAATLGGVSGTGAVATIDFEVDAIGKTGLNLTDTKLGTWDIPSEPIDHEVNNGYFDNTRPLPPEASFTYSPINPAANETITFDATGSSDPDGDIVSYDWDFGDGETGTGNITTHAYAAIGIYTVKLTVTDDYDMTNSTTQDVVVITALADVAIVTVTVSPTTVTAGQTVSVTVVVMNNGTSDETFNVIVRYDGVEIGTQPVSDLARGGATKTLTFLWDTTGVAADTYTIEAEASTVAGETDTADNIKEGGTVTVQGASTQDTLLYYVGAGVAIIAIAIVAVYFMVVRKRK